MAPAAGVITLAFVNAASPVKIPLACETEIPAVLVSVNLATSLPPTLFAPFEDAVLLSSLSSITSHVLGNDTSKTVPCVPPPT